MPFLYMYTFSALSEARYQKWITSGKTSPTKLSFCRFKKPCLMADKLGIAATLFYRSSKKRVASMMSDHKEKARRVGLSVYKERWLLSCEHTLHGSLLLGIPMSNLNVQEVSLLQYPERNYDRVDLIFRGYLRPSYTMGVDLTLTTIFAVYKFRKALI